MIQEGPLHRHWQHRHPVLAAFAVPNREFAPIKIDVLDPQLDTLHESQACPIHQRRHKPHGTAESRQQRGHLGTGEDDRHANGTLSPDDLVHPGEPLPEHHLEENRIALSAWFCVDALTLRAARLERNAVTSRSASSRG
jgi:hypothetical protein